MWAMRHSLLFAAAVFPLVAENALPPQIRFERGTVNSVIIGTETAVMASTRQTQLSISCC